MAIGKKGCTISIHDADNCWFIQQLYICNQIQENISILCQESFTSENWLAYGIYHVILWRPF